MRFRHPCPEEVAGNACTILGTDMIHKESYMHGCKRGTTCSFYINGDQKHLRRHVHTGAEPGSQLPPTLAVPNGNNNNNSPLVVPKKSPSHQKNFAHKKNGKGWLVTEVDKSSLKNPIAQHGADAWKHAPYQKVALSSDSNKTGFVIGWELSKTDVCVSTGNLVVTFGARKESLSPTSLAKVADGKPAVRAPWDHQHTVVWTCNEVSAAFDTVFANIVSGTNGATFMDVFKVVLAEKVIPRLTSLVWNF